MIKKVFKKGGKIEPFSQEKIEKSILNVLSEIGLSQKEREEILNKVMSSLLDFLKPKKEISTAEIEAKIILELQKIIPQAIETWREYRREKKTSFKLQ
jgi:transcriptional regulator NrdR family protein